ncbi:MbcA/ParS/Xre antitoxin family protein [uncultured Spirosoma sp.]|uniref:MbcA/ParS/Xre antitoxin family protein n=1 Tax=uncultured Spirosoma sp. TaxID=278208 RepID=UPI002582BC25|nr:MbcA/ParS/Xre antitoxin family protein [uncultured Spirosoma sp.]
MNTPLQPPVTVGKSYWQPVTDLIQQARQGVLRRRVDEVARLIGLTDKEMAYVLGMSVRSLHGKFSTDALTLAASERLLLLERLIQHGLMVFDGRADRFSRWLHTPLNELGYNETPEAKQSLSVREMGSFQEPMPTHEAASALSNTDTSASVIPQSPLTVLDTVSGFSLVDDVLGRIEWGIVG